MSVFTGVDLLIVLASMTVGAAIRVVGLVVALRGTAPRDRPAIIRALAELFRLLPRKSR